VRPAMAAQPAPAAPAQPVKVEHGQILPASSAMPIHHPAAGSDQIGANSNAPVIDLDRTGTA